MDMTLDQVRQELADIHDELLALPHDAFDRRSQLHDRQNELRQLSSQLVEGEPLHDAAVLKAAYQRLHDARDRVLNQRMQYVSTEAGDAGIAGEITTMINKAMEAGMGLDDIEARMKEIITQLKSSA